MDVQQLSELLTGPLRGEELVSAIRALLEPQLKGAKLRTGNSIIDAVSTLPEFMVLRAGTSGPDEAVRWLGKVLSAAKVSVLRVMPLWGLEVSQPIELADSIRLIPPSELPDLPNWSEPLGARQGLDIPIYQLQPPKAVLVAQTTRELIIRDPGDNSVSDPDVVLDPMDGVLDETRLCLTLVAPSTIVPAPQHSVFEDSDFADLAQLGGYSWRVRDVRPSELRSFGVFDAERAKRLVRAYLALDAGARGRIRLALDRFDRALSRLAPGDTAVELAISLDSLLGDGEQELTWKIGLRSALLVGGTKTERLERRAVIHAVYGLRSKVVHEGRTPTSIKMKGAGKLTPEALIPKAVITTSKVISAAIYRGKLPDWFDEELGPSDERLMD
jgi:Apea-like HEPN